MPERINLVKFAGMKTTASIVTHMTPPAQLEIALSCLRREEISRVYVVDNSPDESLRTVSESNGALYLHVENRGFGAGHNVAIRKAMAEGSSYHLVLNADVWWQDDVVSPLLSFMEANPDVGMSAPRIVYPDGTLQYSCRLLPAPADLLAKRFLPEWLTRKRMRRYLLADADHKKIMNPSYLTGCFLLFRIEALKSEGLFDERFFMYPEDIDITRRIHTRWKTIYYPRVEVVHAHEAASRTNRRMLRIHIANMIRYFNKWGWFFDSRRKESNRLLLDTMPRSTGTPEKGRG